MGIKKPKYLVVEWVTSADDEAFDLYSLYLLPLHFCLGVSFIVKGCGSMTERGRKPADCAHKIES